MEKGSIAEIRIEDMSAQGQGIGRDGIVVFVPDTVPGDVVKAKITKVKKKYAFSELVEIIDPSPDRVEEFCPYRSGNDGMKPCGGCPLGSMSYSAQLELKQKQVTEKLVRLAGADFADPGSDETGETVLRPIIGMDPEECWRYRNKAVMPVSTGGLMTRKGGIQEPVHEPRIGFRPGKSHEVIDCRDCLLQAPSVMAAAEATRRFMLEDNITSYDERWDKGLMKSMTVKTAFGTGEVMVIYEINGRGIPNAAKLAEMLDDAIYEAGVQVSGDSDDPAFSLESIVLRTVKGNRVKTETLVGKNTILDVVEIEGAGQMQFEISPESFYQVNPVQMEKLYGTVRKFVKRAEAPVILDLYCGIGTIGLCLADLAKHVYGIETVKDAVLDANRNATINGIVNATYTWGKAEEIIPEWLGGRGPEEAPDHADIVVLDPPRAGCRPELLQAIAEAGVENIIYVSCDPATLARDIKLLTGGEAGNCYSLIEAVPVDMFPHTSHVEVVSLLSRTEGTTREA